jgi:hypothetical protein
MLTWKRLTTVSKYATALLEDQTSATSKAFWHTSSPGTWPLGKQLGSRVLYWMGELAILTSVKSVLYQPETCAMGGPFVLANKSISQRRKGSTRRTSQNSSLVPSSLSQNCHHHTWVRGGIEAIHPLTSFIKASVALPPLSVNNWTWISNWWRTLMWKTNGADISVVAGWITVLAEGRVAAKVDQDKRTPLKNSQTTYWSGQRPAKKG